MANVPHPAIGKRCANEGCGGLVHARGLCNACYKKMNKREREADYNRRYPKQPKPKPEKVVPVSPATFEDLTATLLGILKAGSTGEVPVSKERLSVIREAVKMVTGKRPAEAEDPEVSGQIVSLLKEVREEKSA